jgi:hypothetical protein
LGAVLPQPQPGQLGDRNAIDHKELQMQRVKLVGLAVLAILALSAVATSMASAANPEFLPGTKNSFKVTGGKAKFEQKGGIAAVECEKSTGTGVVTGPKEGTFDELYENCKAPLAGKCTGLNDTTAGSILAKGSFGVGYISKTEKTVAILFKPEATHFECEKLITLVTVEGCAIGKITPVNSDTKENAIDLKGSKGVQEFIKDEVAECKLESEINGGAKAQSDQETQVKVSLTNLAELMA